MTLLSTLQELELLMKKEQSIYVYGAGGVSKVTLKYASQKGCEVYKVLVSSSFNNPNQIRGVQVEVCTASAIDESGILIICVMEHFHSEILKIVSNYEFEMIYGISDNLYKELMYYVGDYELNILDRVVELEKHVKKELVWENVWERNLTLENWGTYYEEENFAERFLKLVKGLDSESIETVVRIINRHKAYLDQGYMPLDIFTEKEKEELKILKANFSDLIIKLSDDLYMYKNYFLPYKDFEASVLYYKHGIHKIEDISSVKDNVIIDVGGFIGDSALVLSELNPSKVITFEPVPKHFELIKKTISLNNLENVVAENLSLGECEGLLQLKIAGASTSSNRKGLKYEEIVEVPMTSLDKYVEEKQVEKIGLIKVDIEGAEPNFLLGARKTIERDRPILLISIYHNVHDFFEIKPMIESWDLGYRFSIYKPTNGNITNETLLIAESI